MYLDAVSNTATTAETKIIENGGDNFHHSPEVYQKWKDWQPSQISHHGQMCCEIAREWITATDFSATGGGSLLAGPRWLRSRFDWGASSFPIFWCEAVRKKTLDCGALAALAHEAFTARGVRSWRVQLVQKFSHVATAQWSYSWNDGGDGEEDSPLHWIDNDLIYHEGCAISADAADGGEIKVWDASAGWWIDSKAGDGYGSLAAIRLSAANPNASFVWENQRIEANKWQRIN